MKPIGPEPVRCAKPPEQLVYDLVEEWTSLTDELPPEYREAA